MSGVSETSGVSRLMLCLLNNGGELGDRSRDLITFIDRVKEHALLEVVLRRVELSLEDRLEAFCRGAQGTDGLWE